MNNLCPVCNTSIDNSMTYCQNCGFDEIHREFDNQQEAETWYNSVVLQYRKNWLTSLSDFNIGTISGYGWNIKFRLSGYLGNAEQVNIPFGVTEIGAYAFNMDEGTAQIASTEIIDKRLKRYKNIKNITIPDSVTKIGDRAFCWTGYYNDNANWENGILYIDNCLIEVNDIVTNVNVKTGCRLIADCAFGSCERLESVIIPNSVETIGEDAFCKCHNLKSVTIPNSIKTIGRDAFWWCNDNLVIKCSSDSCAHKYAEQNHIKYEII